VWNSWCRRGLRSDHGSRVGKSAVLRLMAERLRRVRDVTVGVLERLQSKAADFYRELGDLASLARPGPAFGHRRANCLGCPGNDNNELLTTAPDYPSYLRTTPFPRKNTRVVATACKRRRVSVRWCCALSYKVHARAFSVALQA
jgi:hypothetical protein